MDPTLVGLHDESYPTPDPEGALLPGIDRRLENTRLLFIALCAYVLSQAFTVPVLAVGPWPVWPRLTDLVMVPFLILWLCSGAADTRLVGTKKRLIRGLVLLFALVSSSYFCLTVLTNNMTAPSLFSSRGVGDGAFALASLGQFIIAFKLAAAVPLSPGRIRVLRGVTGFALVAVCALCLATFTSIVSTSDLSSWLPQGNEVAGAWNWYRSGAMTGSGVGGVGYNHGYTALQINLLLALFLSFSGDKLGLGTYGVIFLSLAAITISGSRSGLLATCLFVFGFLLLRPVTDKLRMLLAFGVASIFAIIYSGRVDTAAELIPVIERQLTAFRFTDTENLAGRTDIWETVLLYLNEHPVHWIVGTGFGSATDVIGSNAHMLPLQILLELGVVGLAIVGYMFVWLMRRLAELPSSNRALLIMTAAFLLTSFSQETFYPVPAFGHFLGFYLASVAMVFSIEQATICTRNNQRQSLNT